MNANEEQAGSNGERAAYVSMLNKCIRALGYDDPAMKSINYIPERESAIAQLRSLCADFGDNDWDESLQLADIIEKHLGRHLYGKGD